MRKILFAVAIFAAIAGGIAVTSSAMADDPQGPCTSPNCK